MEFFVFVSGTTDIPILDLVLILGSPIASMVSEVSVVPVQMIDLQYHIR
jgi:hypothetical protein